MKQFERIGGVFYASYGHCKKDRRTGPGGHTEGDQAHLAHQRGGPVTYNIYSFEGSGSDLQAGGSFETGVGEMVKPCDFAEDLLHGLPHEEDEEK